VICDKDSKWRTLHQPLVEEVSVNVVVAVDAGAVVEDAGAVVAEVDVAARKETRNGSRLRSSAVS
jgi:hypothetical protein